MRFRIGRLGILLAGAALACGGERITEPDPASRDAADLERAAAELGFHADPVAGFAYRSAAAAIRGGVRATPVDITVGGVKAKWYAFGHEIQFELPASASPDGVAPAPTRTVLAWRSAPSGMQMIHFFAASPQGPIGHVELETVVGPTLELPSMLLFAEGRNSLWEAVRGRQTTTVAVSATPCMIPLHPVGGPEISTCRQASFTTGFSDVEAEPFAMPFQPATSVHAGEVRTLAMAPQPIAGIQLKLRVPEFGIPSPSRGTWR